MSVTPMHTSSPETVSVMSVVVISPSDVQRERDEVTAVINTVNRLLKAAQLPVVLRQYRFEEDVPAGIHAQGAQALADQYLPIRDSEFVIAVFGQRLGSPTMGCGSGTEHELRAACESFELNRRPSVMVYLKAPPYDLSTADGAEQIGLLFKFRDEFIRPSMR